jgi:hypothetical protein
MTKSNLEQFYKFIHDPAGAIFGNNNVSATVDLSEPELTPWMGSQRELAAYIIEMYNNGEIKAPNERQAVIKNAGRWILVDDEGNRRTLKPESVWRNYYQQTR